MSLQWSPPMRGGTRSKETVVHEIRNTGQSLDFLSKFK